MFTKLTLFYTKLKKIKSQDNEVVISAFYIEYFESY